MFAAVPCCLPLLRHRSTHVDSCVGIRVIHPNANMSYPLVEGITRAILSGLRQVETAALEMEGSALVLGGPTVPRCELTW